MKEEEEETEGEEEEAHFSSPPVSAYLIFSSSSLLLFLKALFLLPSAPIFNTFRRKRLNIWKKGIPLEASLPTRFFAEKPTSPFFCQEGT